MDYEQLAAHRMVLLDLYKPLCEALDKEGDGLDSELKKMQQNIAAEKFLLAFVGEVKSGKSTFINALLGEAILPYDALQATSEIIEIYKSEKKEVRVAFANGEERVDEDDLETPELQAPVFRDELRQHFVPVSEGQLAKTEQHFGVSLPADYKETLAQCNRGKPTLERFNTERQRECVLDYMIDLEETVAMAQAIPADNLIPIARDPFGNLIAFSLADGQVDAVVFWDHESNDIAKIASSFTEFLQKLY